MVFLIPVAFVIAAGAGTGAEGARRQIKARRTNRNAEGDVRRAQRRHDEAARACTRAGERLGRRKAEVMTREMPALHEQLSRFRNFEFDGSVAGEASADRLKADASLLDNIDFKRWDTVALASAGVVPVVWAAGGSSVAVTGASTALVVGGASTAGGTAISSLSGAALTNATLAWFGGGSIAAGGGGVAAGTLVLSGVATAPAAVVGGAALFFIGRKNLAQAEANAEKARVYVAQADAKKEKLRLMVARANDYDELLALLQRELERSANAVRKIADDQVDFRRLGESERGEIARALELFAMTAELVNCELMRKGRLTASSRKLLVRGRKLIAQAG